MGLLRRIALCLVWDGPRLPWGLAPWLFGFAMGSMPVKVETDAKSTQKPDNPN